MNVVYLSKNDTITFPTTTEQWDMIRTGFESKSGIPNAVGAIDGSLIEIERPNEYDGWYNRKGYPSFNLLAIVDDQRDLCMFLSSQDRILIRQFLILRSEKSLLMSYQQIVTYWLMLATN